MTVSQRERSSSRSDNTAMMTGQTILINGGYTTK
jgi:hypothetical protein